MNLNTIEQELAKKFKSMSYPDYLAFLSTLDKLYLNQHKNISVDGNGNVWIRRKDYE